MQSIFSEIGAAAKSGFRNYLNFSDRANRPEFWYWVLFCIIIGSLCFILDNLIIQPSKHMRLFNQIANVVLFIPGLSIAVRRLHDIGRSGWWQLWMFLIAFTAAGVFIFLGALVTEYYTEWDPLLTNIGLLLFLFIYLGPIFVWMCTKSDAGENRFGPPSQFSA